MKRLALLGLLLSLISACVTSQPSGNWPYPPEQQPPAQDAPIPDQEVQADTDEPHKEEPVRQAVATPNSVNQQREHSKNDAAGGLRDKASSARRSGDYSRAERLMSRALRISPRDAANYYEMALIKLEQSLPAKAVQLAKKGLSLGPEGSLQRRLEQIELEASVNAQ